MDDDGEYTESAGESVNAQEAIEAAEETVGRSLNGAQTQSLISVITQFANGTISEGQAANVIAAAIGVTKKEALAIIRGEI